MKRALIVTLLALSLLTVACATGTATTAADLSGLVSAVDGNTITVTPSGGTPTTVTLVRDTNIFWPGGAHAEQTDIVKGHTVSVWLTPGSQNAVRVNIGS